ncbi:alpha/beta hydrolase [Polaribacter sp.]|uniref:alpha/beta hydrolase family protein n=1 Tax=Polaribacter sp. TaxID=1920175 RepID=UPI0025F22FC7|nr:alpha/beta hydrolase [Polaribacter sp.]
MIRVITYFLFLVFGVVSLTAQIKSEELVLFNNKIELPGRLSYVEEQTPLLIWVHGSGNVDRNGNQQPVIKANYIKQFRDSINKNNIAFYSYDKRTANKKNKASLLKGVFLKDYVTDVQIAINHFKKEGRFSKIVLVGHSQGSLVAMLSSENIDKYISLAGPSKSADQVIIDQIKESAPFLDSITKAHFKELKETGNVEKVNPMLQSVFAKQNQAFLSSWMQYNPSEEIKKLSMPILLINGTEDLQVKPQEASNLLLSNKNTQLVFIKGMNHVLKEVKSMTENQSSYLKPDYPLSTKLVQVIVEFVKK